MDFETKFANDSLPSLEKKLEACRDNLTAAEVRVQSIVLTMGHILLAAGKMFKFGLEHSGGATGAGVSGIEIKGQTFKQWCFEHSGRSWKTCLQYMSYARSPDRLDRLLETHRPRELAVRRLGSEAVKVFKPATYFDARAVKERRIQFAVRACVHLLPDEYTEALRRIEIARANTGMLLAEAAE